MKILISELKQKIVLLLQKNLTINESNCVADYLLWAEMSGIKTQGLVKLIGSNPLQDVTPQHEIRIEKDTKLSQLINAGAYPAPLVSQRATDVVIEKAKEHGFAIVGVHNTFSSNGSQAYYAEQIAKNDLIGIVISRSPGSVAPFNSIDPLFGTNPIGFSFPTNDKPIVFDMATSAMTFYGLVLAKEKGESIPDGVAIDNNGTPTNDPSAAMSGALLPFDRGYKGSGLGMVAEIMAGPMVSSAFCDYKTFDQQWGSTFIAIDPGLLVDVGTFKSQCSEMVDLIRNSRCNNMSTKIRLPNDRASLSYEETKYSGYVDVDDVVIKLLGL